MTTSEKIRARIQAAGASYFANHNISEYIEPGELDSLTAEVACEFEGVLRSLVIDTDQDHNTQDTANRVAKMFVQEIFSGRFLPAPKITSFPNMGYKNLYTTGPISIQSTCAHHFQNITGNCWVGIFPEKEVIGLSKFNRVVQWITRRPQIQEEMTVQIAEELKKFAKTEHVAVIVKANHHCMTARGVREHTSDMTTAIMTGYFQSDASLKNEFYQLFNSMKGH